MELSDFKRDSVAYLISCHGYSVRPYYLNQSLNSHPILAKMLTMKDRHKTRQCTYNIVSCNSTLILSLSKMACL